MAEERSYPSIVDASKPNAGRIYDFVLGGNHNFEVDREAAQKVIEQAPAFPMVARLIRWFLGESVRRLAAEGCTRFIDFASGLPTKDHIHQVTPADTKVIYSDIDPVTVAYGQEILKDNHNARYMVCNAGWPEDLLSSAVVSELLGDDRKVAIGFNGIAFFLNDDEIDHAMKSLYDWVDPGSRLFICDSGFEGTVISPTLEETLNIYKRLGEPFKLRTLDTLKELIRPWKVREPGFRPLEDWVDLKAGVAERTHQTDRLVFQGAILEK